MGGREGRDGGSRGVKRMKCRGVKRMKSREVKRMKSREGR